MAKGPPPRIAVLGFSIECNAFAPPATRADFEASVWLERDAITADARSATPVALPETAGFYAAMDATGPGSLCRSCLRWPSRTGRSRSRCSLK